jgi:hypothetical protein
VLSSRGDVLNSQLGMGWEQGAIQSYPRLPLFIVSHHAGITPLAISGKKLAGLCLARRPALRHIKSRNDRSMYEKETIPKATLINSCAAILLRLWARFFAAKPRHKPIIAAFCGFKPRSKCLQSCLPLVNQRCLRQCRWQVKHWSGRRPCRRYRTSNRKRGRSRKRY